MSQEQPQQTVTVDLDPIEALFVKTQIGKVSVTIENPQAEEIVRIGRSILNKVATAAEASMNAIGQPPEEK